MNPVSRRAVLVAGAGGAGALVLAGCSSSGSDGASNAPADTTSAGSTTAGATSAGATASAASSEGSSAASSDSSAATGTEIATLADIQVGSAASVKLANGKDGIVTRTGTDTAVAFSAICTHMGCTVKPEATRLHCPCHQSNFDLKTGDVLNGPASSPLEKVSVTVSGGKVLESSS